MDDFGLTMDELMLMDGIASEGGVLGSAANATMEKLERLGMMARDWAVSLPRTVTPEVVDLDPTGAW